MPPPRVLPHVRPDEGVAAQHGAGLGTAQVGRGLVVDGQDEVAHAQPPVPADGAAVDDAADDHPEPVLYRAHRHTCDWGYTRGAITQRIQVYVGVWRSCLQPEFRMKRREIHKPGLQPQCCT